MPDRRTTVRWLVVAVVAIGAALAFGLPKASDDAPASPETKPTVARSASGASKPSKPSLARADGGLATRRVAEDCDPVVEALAYEPFIDKRALVVLSWDGMRERAAALRIPVYVVGIEDGNVAVRFLPIPMREIYINLWQQSGHIQRGPKESFLLDPCSATIEEWPELERGEDYDLDEDLADDEDVDPYAP